MPDSKECKGYGSSWCANWLWLVPAISLQCCIMDAQTLKCKNKQTNERTKNPKNQETKEYTIVQQNLSGLIADMDRVTRYLKNQSGLGWMTLGRLNE